MTTSDPQVSPGVVAYVEQLAAYRRDPSKAPHENPPVPTPDVSKELADNIAKVMATMVDYEPDRRDTRKPLGASQISCGGPDQTKDELVTRGPQPMPVADAICSPGRVILYPPYDKNDPMLSTKNLQNCPQWAWSTKFRDDMLIKCKRVNFGVAPSQNEVMPVRGIDVLDPIKLAELLRDAVGPQTLPFDHLWFEGTWPSAEQWLSPHTEAVAVRVKTGGAIYRDTGQLVPPNTNSSLDLFCLLKNGYIVRQPVLLLLHIDPAGMPLGVTMNGYAADYVANAEVNDQDLIWWTLGMVLPAMWAIGLMNCKNVKTQEAQRIPTKTRKQHRVRNKNLLSYHTIVLPNMNNSGGAGDGTRAGLTRLHTVRGHFATYTAAAIDKYLRAELSPTSGPLWHGRNGRLTYAGLTNALRQRAVQAGVKGFHVHRLRHSAAVRWLTAGGTEGGLMAQAGWKDRAMLDRYVATAREQLAAEEFDRLQLDTD